MRRKWTKPERKDSKLSIAAEDFNTPLLVINKIINQKNQ